MASEETEDPDAGPTSYDEIYPGLFLGNLTAATNVDWLREAKISHVLTADSCPLPRKIQLLPDLTLKYIRITDMPREDFLMHFEDSYRFIDYALAGGGRVLVHCYFGVSRSATLAIAYVMKKCDSTLAAAFDVVKSKRRFVGPNRGFLAQLKLYEDMGCSIDNTNVQFKMYKLQVAADMVRKARILPGSCVDLVKADPALATVRPEPTVYRCKRCRRIVASASNVLPHVPRERQIWRHVSKRRGDGKSPKNAAKAASPANVESAPSVAAATERPRDTESPGSSEFCDKTYFIEPLAWMPDIVHSVEGKLNCPKCDAKLGSFSWISGSQCPCGTKIAPAFYLVPSKVDWSNAVQNVLVTV